MSSLAHAEPSRERQLRYQIAVSALGGLPAGSDDAPSNTPGYGLELGGGAGLVGWPVTVGGDLRALHWNETTRQLTLYIDEHAFPAEFTRLEQTVTFSGWLRVHPEIWRFRPYVEAAAGLGGSQVERPQPERKAGLADQRVRFQPVVATLSPIPSGRHRPRALRYRLSRAPVIASDLVSQTALPSRYKFEPMMPGTPQSRTSP